MTKDNKKILEEINQKLSIIQERDSDTKIKKRQVYNFIIGVILALSISLLVTSGVGFSNNMKKADTLNHVVNTLDINISELNGLQKYPIIIEGSYINALNLTLYITLVFGFLLFLLSIFLYIKTNSHLVSSEHIYEYICKDNTGIVYPLRNRLFPKMIKKKLKVESDYDPHKKVEEISIFPRIKSFFFGDRYHVMVDIFPDKIKFKASNTNYNESLMIEVIGFFEELNNEGFFTKFTLREKR